MLTTKPKEKRKRQQWRMSSVAVYSGLSFEFLAPHFLDECVARLQQSNAVLTKSDVLRPGNKLWTVDVSAINPKTYQYNFQRAVMNSAKPVTMLVKGTFSYWTDQSTLIKGVVRLNSDFLFRFVFAISLGISLFSLLVLVNPGFLVCLVGTIGFWGLFHSEFMFHQSWAVQDLKHVLTD